MNIHPHPSLSPIFSPSCNSAADDVALVNAIGSGDQLAMTVIYNRYSGLICGTAWQVLKSHADAEDVMQELLIRFWHRPMSIDPSRGSLRGWLLVVARHCAIDALRRRKPSEALEDVVVAATNDLEADVERNTALRRIRIAMKVLHSGERELIEMTFFEGLTHSEIAARTKQPLGTVKTRIRRGMLRLKSAVGEASAHDDFQMRRPGSKTLKVESSSREQVHNMDQ